MDNLKTCGQVAAGYQILVDVTKANGGDPEEYFNSEEGKAAIEDMLVELRKLK